ncbi:serine/threonine-protein kinase [Melittangium boletus]|uniref:Protein kinase domain-containing protein n=1 Tax=Melittangium boletus DSM 14713 TaxID=1294270 RepID=A0A286NUZ4_9BACT|nr:serine/threonine-protein kinase [Melittangium boletus]ATB26857.1 hypothetical protein MEBOL_000291 [Melittangium boletus DSM 14713]
MTQPVSTDIRVGSVLRDTYEITSLLGKGGMGAVFLARHRRLRGKQVAVKVLLHSASLNPELYARFQREAEIASQLGHPNIVEVLDFDTLQDGTPFLVMEYLRGESLEQRLERGPLPLSEAMGLVRQMGSGLQAAHRAGIVHRDLKPANVFLVPTDSGGTVGEQVKLLDFGISKMLDSKTLQTQDSVLMGTPQYMAPEQALGKNSEISARTDLFALGCIVYEMLTGRPPFAAEPGLSVVQVMFRIIHTQPEPLASLCLEAPESVIAAVNRALSKTPDDRFPDVAAFIAALTGTPLRSLPGMVMPASLAARNAAEAAGTGRFEDDGLGSTHVPSSTARFATPPPATEREDDLGLGATHIPASTARFATPPPAAMPDAVTEEELGLGATHIPAPPPAVLPAPEIIATGASPSAPAVLSSRRRGALAGVGLLILGLVAARGWMGARSEDPPAVPPSPPSVAAHPEPSAPVQAEKPVAPPAPVFAPVPESDPDLVSEPAPQVAVAPVKDKPRAQVTSRTQAKPPAKTADMPEKARALLDEAEAALTAGRGREAFDLARQSQQVRVTAEAYSVQVRASCLSGELGQAQAKWREGQESMASRVRVQVKRYCKKQGIEF